MEGEVIEHLYEGNVIAGKKYQFNWNVGSNASGMYITVIEDLKKRCTIKKLSCFLKAN
jgi:hypothetical protein